MMKAEILQAARHPADGGAPWSRDEFEAKLRERGKCYHIHHPFNVMLNTGQATPEQIRGWVANRFYYQIAIPVKDAAVLSNCPDREVRRGWVQRILDHDGFEIGGIKDPGGIEAWLRLAQAVGLTREEVLDQRHVIPALRFAAQRPPALRSLSLFGPIAPREGGAPPASPGAWRLLTMWEQYRRFVADVPRGQPPVLADRHIEAWSRAWLATDPDSATRTPPAVKVPCGPVADLLACAGGQALDAHLRGAVAVVDDDEAALPAVHALEAPGLADDLVGLVAAQGQRGQGAPQRDQAAVEVEQRVGVALLAFGVMPAAIE